MDADIAQAFAALNAKVDNLTSATNFLLARVLLMTNDVAELRAELAAVAATAATISTQLASQGASLAVIQNGVSAEGQAIGVLTGDVNAAVALIQQLRDGGTLPQDVFDSLGQLQQTLTNVAAAGSASQTALDGLSTSISSASNAIGVQATALANAVTPPTGGRSTSAPASPK